MALESNPDPCSRPPVPALPTLDPPACSREQAYAGPRAYGSHSTTKKDRMLASVSLLVCGALLQNRKILPKHVCPNIETLTCLHEELSQTLTIQISITFFLGKRGTGMCTKQIN